MDSLGRIAGYANIFNQQSSPLDGDEPLIEIIKPGAFQLLRGSRQMSNITPRPGSELHGIDPSAYGRKRMALRSNSTLRRRRRELERGTWLHRRAAFLR
jgi:hypothetical protein